jgi:chorismate mutase
MFPNDAFLTPNTKTGLANGRYVRRHVKENRNDLITSDVFSLDSIRATLIRQEETIIFAMIERAQFRRNLGIYDPTHISRAYGQGTLADDQGESVSLLQWMLTETEKLHAKVRRFTSPEEHAFFPNSLPEPVLPALDFPKLITPESKKVSDVNPEILYWYTGKILERLCVDGDDEQYGSSSMCDIACLQALSRRIHYGKFVAESKFLGNPDKYRELVSKGDTPGIIELLTNVEVEEKVIRRAFAKTSTYGQDIGVAGPSEENTGYKVEPKLIADIYRDMIIPLTKDVEVRYLYYRADGSVAPPPDTYLDICRGPKIDFSS